MKNQGFPFLLMLFLFGCAPDSGSGEEDSLSAELICEVVSADSAATHADVYGRVAERKMKIGAMPFCGTISPAAFPQYGIPAQVESAVGGEMKGRVHFYYVVREEERIIFYHGWKVSDRLVQREVARFHDGQFELVLPAQ